VPEGDTVYQTAARLDRALSGQVLTASDLRVPKLATVDLAGVRVTATVPRGKNLLTRLDNDLTLHTHLVMEGRWDVHPAGTRWRRPAFQARVVLRTATTEAVGFDVRVRLVPTTEEDTLVGHLGPDLLGADWDADEAVRRLATAPDRALGDALLDQANLAGVGNVYKSELCFLAGVRPTAPVAAVADLPRLVDRAHRLLVANKDRVDRVTTGEQRRGRRLWVYGRRGPCLRCGTPVQRADVGEPGRERPTYWCPRCQPA
jgi:endonuclease-8